MKRIRLGSPKNSVYVDMKMAVLSAERQKVKEKLASYSATFLNPMTSVVLQTKNTATEVKGSESKQSTGNA